MEKEEADNETWDQCKKKVSNIFTDSITLSEIKNKRTLLYKKTINTTTKENFKNILARKTWDYVKEMTILMKPIANFCMIFPHFMTKLFQN